VEVSAPEAARRLGVSPQTIRRRIRDGRLTGRRDDRGRWLVTLTQLGAEDGTRPDTSASLRRSSTPPPDERDPALVGIAGPSRDPCGARHQWAQRLGINAPPNPAAAVLLGAAAAASAVIVVGMLLVPRGDVGASIHITSTPTLGRHYSPPRTHRRLPQQSAPSPREAAGRRVFLTAGCADCHTLASVHARGNVGPNLDKALGALPPAAIVKLVRHKVIVGGGGMIPYGLGMARWRIRAVAAFVAHTVTH
jgi:excisionase family DNA binding protein